VGPDFFETAGMRIVAGRGLAVGDMTDHQRVAVVTEQFARFFYGSAQEAVGHLVNRDVLIVGVAADAKFNTFRDAPARALFLPYTQSPPRPVMTLIVKPSADQRRTIDAVVPAIARHDPRLKVKVTTLADQAAATVGVERFAAATAATLTLLALCLAGAGVYSTVAYAVSERRSELAVRVVVGVTPGRRVQSVMRDPIRLALAGIAIAVPGSYVLMRAISTLLFGVSAFDVPVLLASATGLILTTVAAAALPAWRAAAIDPHDCLKTP
jgi:putative ABC transport system permease protein